MEGGNWGFCMIMAEEQGIGEKEEEGEGDAEGDKKSLRVQGEHDVDG